MNSTNPELPADVVECINNWIVTFALAYHRRKDKDISNDAAEFITDELSMPNALTEYATKMLQEQQEKEFYKTKLISEKEFFEDGYKDLQARHTTALNLLQTIYDMKGMATPSSAPIYNEIKTFLDGTK
jgi:hypothetical protein